MAARFSVRAELAAAVRQVNVAFNALDADARDRVEIVDDGDLEAILRIGDDSEALREIQNWERRQSDAVRKVVSREVGR